VRGESGAIVARGHTLRETAERPMARLVKRVQHIEPTGATLPCWRFLSTSGSSRLSVAMNSRLVTRDSHEMHRKLALTFFPLLLT
jgi:hypothetical protein